MVQYDVNDLIKTLINLDFDNADLELVAKLRTKMDIHIGELDRNDDNV